MPSPEGGRQTKSCSDGKTCLAKVDRSVQVTIEKLPPFFYLGSVSWPWRRCRRCGVAGGERVPPAPLLTAVVEDFNPVLVSQGKEDTEIIVVEASGDQKTQNN